MTTTARSRVATRMIEGSDVGGRRFEQSAERHLSRAVAPDLADAACRHNALHQRRR